MQLEHDTIAAIATPPGRGGVGIIRISGSESKRVAKKILGKIPKPRQAEYLSFYDNNKKLIDQGIAIFFVNPHSFTGEDILELHGHGGPVVLDILLNEILNLGIRMANPGEFSLRAFLNGKIDLTQAEAIADLINSTTSQAAHAAINSLQGEFSKLINELVEKITHLRIYVEAAIDFPDEEIDFLSDGKIANALSEIIESIKQVRNYAKQGRLLNEGIKIAIIGKPNAGKSSLLNLLTGQESAIVTDIPGTTRDLLRENIQIDGIPLHIIDTAGLRESPDIIELEGIKRANIAIQEADHILIVIDGSESEDVEQAFSQLNEVAKIDLQKPKTLLINKIDKLKIPAKMTKAEQFTCIYLSAKTKSGLDLLKQHLKKCMGFEAEFEGGFIARRRHLDAIERGYNQLFIAQEQLHTSKALELVAEDLRLTQNILNEITGEFSSDDLLGKIFSSFCIGK